MRRTAQLKKKEKTVRHSLLPTPSNARLNKKKLFKILALLRKVEGSQAFVGQTFCYNRREKLMPGFDLPNAWYSICMQGDVMYIHGLVVLDAYIHTCMRVHLLYIPLRTKQKLTFCFGKTFLAFTTHVFLFWYFAHDVTDIYFIYLYENFGIHACLYVHIFQGFMYRGKVVSPPKKDSRV